MKRCVDPYLNAVEQVFQIVDQQEQVPQIFVPIVHPVLHKELNKIDS